MKKKIRQKLSSKKRKIERRLKKALEQDGDFPSFKGGNIHYELSRRNQAITHGGIGAIHMLAQKIGLVRLIDEMVEVLKVHKPYHESDHVLNIAYNSLCGGKVLEDIEVRRNNEVFLDAMGTESIPDPTTAGDFCRRFHAPHVHVLMDAFNEAQLAVWRQQPPSFTQQTARIDADGSLVPTTGECKETIALFEEIEADTPDSVETIHIVCDNISIHKGKLAQQWLKRHPRFRMPHAAPLLLDESSRAVVIHSAPKAARRTQLCRS